MTTICTTIIICVLIICAARLYPLWLEHDRKKAEKAMKIVSEVREENSRLRKELDKQVDNYLEEFYRQDKTISEIFEKFYELTEKIGKQ